MKKPHVYKRSSEALTTVSLTERRMTRINTSIIN